MEDKLPKKWFIIRNRENHKVLNKYHNKEHNISSAFLADAATMFSDKPYCGGNHSKKAILDGYQEITFEQFKRYVLNKQSESVINNDYEIF